MKATRAEKASRTIAMSLALLLVLALALATGTTSVRAASLAKNAWRVSGTTTNNVSDNNYTTWSSVTDSYLMQNSDGTLTRVEYIDGTGVLVETYSASYELKSSKTLSAELSLFGGFYAGASYNFLVFGQSNTSESDSCEVLRVVKYDKSWNRIAQCSICGANTYIPFDAGSLRMTETGGQLYVYTCHEMYESSDGYHHQANMTFVISESEMTVEQSYYNIMNISYGYVSHSFNQFIQTDGTYVYRVDHGDARPRAVSITRCTVGGSITSVTYTLPLSIQGTTGVNATGVSVGGFELSSSSCLIVGNSVDQSDADSYSASGKRNIFLTVTDKDLGSTSTVWLTNYSSSSTVTVRTPQLVKLGSNSFLILWEEYDSSTKTISVKAVTVNGSGSLTSDIATLNGRLSDCQPILASDGSVRWYASNGLGVVMYAIDPDNLSATGDMDLLPVSISGYTLSLSGSSFTYTGSAIKPTTTLKDSSGNTLTAGTDYTVAYSDNTNVGTATVTVTGAGRYTGTKSKTFRITKANQTLSVKTAGNTSLTVGGTTTWTAQASGGGTVTYSSGSPGVAEIDSATGKVTAKAVGTATIYATAAATNNYYARRTEIATITVKPTAPTLSSIANVSDGIKIKWKKVSGATGYQIYRSTSKNSSYTLIGSIVDPTTVCFTDTGSVKSLSSGKAYYYRITTVTTDITGIDSSESDLSSAKSIRYLKPASVSSLTNTSKGITVKWKKVSGASGYYIYRKTGSGSYKKIKTITSGSTVKYSDTAVKSKNGTTYTYKVMPYYKNSSGKVTKGTAASSKKTVRLTAVTVSSVKNSSSKAIKVKWKKNSKATGYQIQYSTSSSFASSKTKSKTIKGAATLSKKISSLTKGKTYYVRVRVYKSVSGKKYYSAWSAKKKVRITK